jgi:hypothetical protein
VPDSSWLIGYGWTWMLILQTQGCISFPQVTSSWEKPEQSKNMEPKMKDITVLLPKVSLRNGCTY